MVTAQPDSGDYRFFDAGEEVGFLYRMIRLAVEQEMPQGIAWLRNFDRAQAALNAELDMPQKDLATLIRMIQSNGGRLSAHRRKQFSWSPADVLDRVETVVRESFDAA